MRGPRGLAAALLAALAAGCAHAPPAEAPAVSRAKTFFPLAVGNRWTYSVEFLGAQQQLTVSIIAGEHDLYQDSRGQRFMVSPEGIRDEHRFLLKEPLEVGQRWQSVIDVSTTEQYRVAEDGVTAEVPAGRFEGCLRIEAKSPQGPGMVLVADQTYCPRVGLVQVVTFQERSGRRGPAQWHQKLMSYRVGE